MTETRPISLGGRTFDVPALPLRINLTAYPLCRKLSSGSLLERIRASSGALDCTADEMLDLVDLAFLGVRAADPSVDRAAFEDLAVLPSELIDALFTIRYQTGGWIPVEPKSQADAAEDDAAGEAQGEATPPTSTSAGSSPS